MASAAVRQMQLLQRSLYDRAYAEANASASIRNPQLLNYSRNYEDSLPESFSYALLSSMLKEIHASQFMLYGDFHTHKQSQRGLMRVLRSYRDKYPSRKVILAVEAFKYDDTKHLNAYLNGDIDEVTLLKRSDYTRDWGFPWPNYKMIIEMARDLKIEITGINSPNAGRDPLASRDKFVAAKMIDIAAENPGALIACIIGEYHLADNHLPKALESLMRKREDEARIVRVVNNIDHYYFAMEHTETAETTEYLKLRDRLFCVMNSPPWIKWQSFAIWEEMRGLQADGSYDDADEDLVYTEEQFDIDYQFLGLLDNIAKFVGSSIPKQAKNQFSIINNLDDTQLTQIQNLAECSEQEFNCAIERSTVDGFYMFSRSNRIVLSDLTLNNLAEAAGQYLQRVLCDFDDIDEHPSEAFYRRVIKNAAGMIASKILNPRRKGPDLAHFKALVKRSGKKRLLGHAKTRREAARQILRHHDWILNPATAEVPNLPSILYKMDLQCDFEISQTLGHMLGQALYTANMNDRISQATVRELFESPLRGTATSLHAFLKYYRLTM